MFWRLKYLQRKRGDHPEPLTLAAYPLSLRLPLQILLSKEAGNLFLPPHETFCALSCLMSKEGVRTCPWSTLEKALPIIKTM